MKTEEIQKLCEYYNIEDYSINDDRTVNVNNDVYLAGKQLQSLPLKFGVIYGNFYCENNQLTSLEGCPKKLNIVLFAIIIN